MTEDRLLNFVLTVAITVLLFTLGFLVVITAIALVDAVGVFLTLLVFAIFAVLSLVVGAAVADMTDGWD